MSSSLKLQPIWAPRTKTLPNGPLRSVEGIKWSDGEDLNADDVVFTFNMIKENDKIGASAATNLYIDKVEKVDDYTVKFTMKESFPRFTQRYGITVWGTDYRIVPEHIYSQQADVTTFKDEQPVVAGPYTVEDYDPNGDWILYKLRDDWKESTLGVVGTEHYNYSEDQVPAEVCLVPLSWRLRLQTDADGQQRS